VRCFGVARLLGVGFRHLLYRLVGMLRLCALMPGEVYNHTFLKPHPFLCPSPKPHASRRSGARFAALPLSPHHSLAGHALLDPKLGRAGWPGSLLAGGRVGGRAARQHDLLSLLFSRCPTRELSREPLALESLNGVLVCGAHHHANPGVETPGLNFVPLI
jgi:hypothetical protein